MAEVQGGILGEPEGVEEQDIPRSLVANLRTHSQSDRDAFVALHTELHRLARIKMRSERIDHTLQPTALVNEAFIKIFRGNIPQDFWIDRSRAIRYIVRAMGQLLNDYADASNSQKRGGGNKRRIVLEDAQQAKPEFASSSRLGDLASLVTPESSERIVAVREALDLLRRTAPRQAEIVELMFYGGLSQEEIAALLDVSVETVKLDWRKAKAFLHLTLSGQSKLG
jgi:RNA polymerase sigma factor (TIGR02999 family)